MANDPPGNSSQLPTPEDFAKLSLPVEELASNTPLYRIHKSHYSPLFFPSQATKPGHTPTYRFDDPRGHFGVMYASLQKVGAFAETVTRGFFDHPPHLPRILSWSDYSDRSITTVLPKTPLRVVNLVDDSVVLKLGFDTNLMTCADYTVPQEWSRLVHDHPENVDGIQYIARHAPSCRSLAIFDRVGSTHFSKHTSHALTASDIPEEILLYLYEAGFTLVP